MKALKSAAAFLRRFRSRVRGGFRPRVWRSYKMSYAKYYRKGATARRAWDGTTLH